MASCRLVSPRNIRNVLHAHQFCPLPYGFRDGPLADALRYLPPHERPELWRMAWEQHADDRGHEPTFTLSVRIPVSLLIRLDIERANVKRALRRRRATRSDTVRYLIEQKLASLDRQNRFQASHRVQPSRGVAAAMASDSRCSSGSR